MDTSVIMGSLVLLAILALVLGGAWLRTRLIPKAMGRFTASVERRSERDLPRNAAELGTGLRLQTDSLTAGRLVSEHLGAKPKRYVAQPDGSWTVRGVDRDDLVLEFVTAGVPELRARSFVDHDSQPFALTEWIVLKKELADRAGRAGIATGPGAAREFARAQQLSPTSWRWLPVG